jgi:Protein of unknown function (DUF1353)
MVPQPFLIPVNHSQFVLADDYHYAWEVEGKRWRVLVRHGFITDIASVPRFAWTLTGIKPDGLQRAAAVIHDLLYQWRGLPQMPAGVIQMLDEGTQDWLDSGRRWSREECDRLFRQILTEAGESPWRINLMFWAVRGFGSVAWNR